MNGLVYCPAWFHGKDILIDIVSVVVLLLIALVGAKHYKLCKSMNYLCLAAGFATLALSFILKIATNFAFYSIPYAQLQQHALWLQLGVFLYRVTKLLGLFMLFSLYNKQSKASVLLITYLLVISLFLSMAKYYFFHLTSLILLLFITYSFYHNYKKKKHSAGLLLSIAFSIIAASQVIFIFSTVSLLCYVVAEVIQLVGYIVLLLTLIMVIHHGKKKQN